MKMAYFAFYGEGKQATERRNLLVFLKLDMVPRNSAPVGLLTFEEGRG